MLDNVTFIDGTFLSIQAGANLNLNNFYIKCEGTGKIEIIGTVEGAYAEVYANSEIKGLYSDIDDAIENLTTGQTVKVHGSLAMDSELTLTSGVNLELLMGATLNLNAALIFDGGLLTLNTGASIVPEVRLMNGTTIEGLYPTITSAFLDGDVVEVYGEYTSSVNVEVDLGESLIPQSGSELKFASGKYLEIESGGNLTANGATFTSTSGTWGGIKYNSGSTGSLTNCTISNSIYGVYLNGSDRDITNCTITTNSLPDYGIYCYNCSPSADISNNTITSNYGIYCYNSSPDIRENEIITGLVGLYCDSYSSPLLVWQEAGTDGNNYFHGTYSEFGVYANNNSCPVIGMRSCGLEYFGRNSFVYNDLGICLIYNGSNDTIKAEQCYWGTPSPSSGLFSGKVDWNPYLTSIPSYSPQAPSPENNLYDTRMMLSGVMPEEEASEDLTRYYNEQWNLEKKTEFIRYLYIIGEAKGVADLCKDIIFENPYAPEAFTALDMIYQISRNEKIKKDFDKDMIKTYLKTFEDSRGNEYLEANAILLLAGLEKDLNLMDKVYKEHKDTYMGKYALHQKFMYYFNETDDSVAARTVLNEMDEVYPNEAVTYESHVLMGDKVIDPAEFYSRVHKMGTPQELQSTPTDIADAIPEEYALNAAYPNPFNPSVTLEFALPIQSHVECSIYDLRGNLVKEYSYEQNAGTYSIVWDASNVSSGIYLIRFTAEAEDGSETFVDYQKVTLLK